MSSESTDRSPDETFDTNAVARRLSEELPRWYYASGWICRKYRSSGWKSTLMIINAVGHLAEAAWHHPEIEASYGFVIVKLMNHAAGGVTEKDFELAKRIEALICWQPGTEDGPLEGTPSDDRFRYIRYD